MQVSYFQVGFCMCLLRNGCVYITNSSCHRQKQCNMCFFALLRLRCAYSGFTFPGLFLRVRCCEMFAFYHTTSHSHGEKQCSVRLWYWYVISKTTCVLTANGKSHNCSVLQPDFYGGTIQTQVVTCCVAIQESICNFIKTCAWFKNK